MSMSKAADPKYGIKKSALLPLNNENSYAGVQEYMKNASNIAANAIGIPMKSMKIP